MPSVMLHSLLFGRVGLARIGSLTGRYFAGSIAFASRLERYGRTVGSAAIFRKQALPHHSLRKHVLASCTVAGLVLHFSDQKVNVIPCVFHWCLGVLASPKDERPAHVQLAEPRGVNADCDAGCPACFQMLYIGEARGKAGDQGVEGTRPSRTRMPREARLAEKGAAAPLRRAPRSWGAQSGERLGDAEDVRQGRSAALAARASSLSALRVVSRMVR